MGLLKRSASINGLTHYYEVPNDCPYCGRAIEPKTTYSPVSDTVTFAFHRCTNVECGKNYWTVYTATRFTNQVNCDLQFIYPHAALPPISESIASLSPSFVAMYLQAHSAGASGSFELAACGYRNALEILIKDYAITVVLRGEYNLKAMHQKPLQACIEEYLTGFDERMTAFLIKEFGNDATHYPPLSEEKIDFEHLKYIFELFLKSMDAKLMLLRKYDELPEKTKRKLEAPVG